MIRKATTRILPACAAVLAAFILGNYIGMPVSDATGTIVDVRDNFSGCYVKIQSDGLGLITDQDRHHHECPKMLHDGQRVTFQYRQGRFLKSTLLWKGTDSIKRL